MKFDEIPTQIAIDDNAAIFKKRDSKKAYVRPMLTQYGKVSKLTAAISGSDVDTLGGNDFT